VRLTSLGILCGLLALSACQSQPTSRPIAAPEEVVKVRAVATNKAGDQLLGESDSEAYTRPDVTTSGGDITGVNWYRGYFLKNARDGYVRVRCSVYERLFIHANTNTGLRTEDITVNSVSSNANGVVGDDLTYTASRLPGNFRLELTRILYVKRRDGTKVPIGADYYVRVRNAGDDAAAVRANSSCTFYMPSGINDVQGRTVIRTYDSGGGG
jgi:hypothetical protein